ncbi:DinB family protein [Bacillus massiliigorillae]|uniref:DinB family protein n=1 Tax=Bacillus massiliigorillae TaxID=1243664 RepID=UPI0003A5D12F|nr:DinB family protein [Bacillus massiliigorillae]
MSKQFQITRQMLLNFVQDVNGEVARIQPERFNNNIHWHIGHLLVTSEYFMFGYPKKSSNIPVEYASLFSMGTSPAAWEGEVPSIQELSKCLKEQAVRINAIHEDFFEQRLPFKFPVDGIETYSDLYALMLHHEAEHLGQMKAMKKAIQA